MAWSMKCIAPSVSLALEHASMASESMSMSATSPASCTAEAGRGWAGRQASLSQTCLSLEVRERERDGVKISRNFPAPPTVPFQDG